MSNRNLIDLDKLKGDLGERFLGAIIGNANAINVMEVLDVINKQPLVDENHAHWVKVNVDDAVLDELNIGKQTNAKSLSGRLYRCSHCGKDIVTNGIDRTDKCIVAIATNPYCRWCGYRMDEGRNA